MKKCPFVCHSIVALVLDYPDAPLAHDLCGTLLAVLGGIDPPDSSILEIYEEVGIKRFDNIRALCEYYRGCSGGILG